MITLSLFALVGLTAGCGGKTEPNHAGGGAQPNAPQEETKKKLQWDNPPEMTIDPSKKYKATFQTSKGSFTVELFADTAPKTVNNFVFLAKEGFYEGVTFHRIVPGYIIQSGDPTGTGMGSPGYQFEDELGGGRKYETGIVAMANSMKADTNGSQFFICTGENSKALNSQPNFTIFGKVIEGMDNVLKIDAVPTKRDARGELSKPTEQVTIDSITIAAE